MEKISKEQYDELVEKVAEEIIGSVVMEKEAGPIMDFAKGNRDFSKEEDQKTKFWKDRYAPYLPVSAVTTPIAMGGTLASMLAAKKNPLAAAGGLIATEAATMGAAVAMLNARGKNLAEKNNVEFDGGDLAASTLIPFVTPDSIVKKKVREEDAADVVKEAAEALVYSVLEKQAAFDRAEEAEMVVEASERALNELGYSLFAE